ncbi:MAG: MopE-related protein, partial [Bacteroidota bacterium]
SNTDCNDLNPAVYPGATEVCNLIDDDCDNQIDEGVQTTFYQDLDGDTYGNPNAATQGCTQPNGYVANNFDCNDTNPTIYAGAPETCNLLDDDCDNQIDEGVQNTYYADVDGDTFGNPNSTTLACTQPTGYVSNNTDCNDNNPAINPNTIWYLDADADGYYVATLTQCTSPGVGYNTTGGINGDCNDNNPAINAGANETCNLIDDNCNGQIDEGVQNTYYQDADGDTYGNSAATTLACTQPAGYVSNSTDCDDTNATIYPGANETCNGIDDDCDNLIDEGVQTTYYVDADGDGFGDVTQFTQACTQPAGYVLSNTDCNDLNPAVYPGATEVCNLIDDDCDNQIDEGVQTTFYQDLDGDTYGNPNAATQGCTQPTGYVTNNFDCNDTNPTIYAGAPETCNLLDDDCDNQIDEGVQTAYYADIDLDGFGDAINDTLTCTQPAGYVLDNTDCNDNDSAINPNTVWYLDADGDGYYVSTLTQCITPGVGYNTVGGISGDCNDNDPAINAGAIESCNNVDDDCSGVVDDNLVYVIYYADADGDGFGDPLVDTLACISVSGYILDNTDCNDTDASINPNTTWYEDADGDGYYITTIIQCVSPGISYNTTGGINGDCDDSNSAINAGVSEICNEIDDNCNTLVDEGVQISYYFDADLDGFGDANTDTLACSAPAGYVTSNTDCNDNDVTINPSGIEICNGIDENCNNFVDEGVLTTYFADLDNDTFGDASNDSLACSLPVGYVTDNSDCNDNDAFYNPLTIWYLDADGDGFYIDSLIQCTQPSTAYTVTQGIFGDCNDFDSNINANATEICNFIDDNCNTFIDEGAEPIPFYADNDSDGFGDVFNDSLACFAPIGYVLDSYDCDDTNPSINPAMADICNNIDDNCNGFIDEGQNSGECADIDNDGLNAYYDQDDDNDGVLDINEELTALNNGDTDLDGVPDRWDLDSDNDGIFDILENLGNDPDGDGMIGAGPIVDGNFDGIDDSIGPNGISPLDTDLDGQPNFQDLDSDADTVPDAVEYDNNNDGVVLDDTDADGNYDFLDSDDDADGLLTSIEWDYNLDGNSPDDCDYDGIPNYLDADACQLFIPEGFSPNGDGTNDTFIIENYPPGSTIKIQIFNRWGDEVFASDNYLNDWTGDDLPVGTYFYIIQFSTEEQGSAGYLTLWR